jgi:large subunit ribosomal protein L22
MKMQARARARFLRASPKKMRQVADLIKGKPVEEAINILQFTPKGAAHHLVKTVKSAAANAISQVGTAKLKAEDLSIAHIFVDAAPTAKRVRFQSMGRVFRIRKRFCHLTVEVEGTPQEETKPKRRGKAKAEKEDEEETKPKKKRVRKTRSKKETAAEKTEAAEGVEESEEVAEEDSKKADTDIDEEDTVIEDNAAGDDEPEEDSAEVEQDKKKK